MVAVDLATQLPLDVFVEVHAEHSAMNTALAPRSIALSIKRVMSPKLWIPRRGSVKYLYAVNLAQPKEETLRSLYAGSLLTRRGPRCIGVVWGYGVPSCRPSTTRG